MHIFLYHFHCFTFFFFFLFIRSRNEEFSFTQEWKRYCCHYNFHYITYLYPPKESSLCKGNIYFYCSYFKCYLWFFWITSYDCRAVAKWRGSAQLWWSTRSPVLLKGVYERHATWSWEQPRSAISPLTIPACSLSSPIFLSFLFDDEIFRTGLFHFKCLNGRTWSPVIIFRVRIHTVAKHWCNGGEINWKKKVEQISQGENLMGQATSWV